MCVCRNGEVPQGWGQPSVERKGVKPPVRAEADRQKGFGKCCAVDQIHTMELTQRLSSLLLHEPPPSPPWEGQNAPTRPSWSRAPTWQECSG